MQRRKGSGRPQTATTPEKKKAVEEMICSQEDHLGTHVLPKDIAEGLKISQSSVRRMNKRRGIKKFKLLKKPYINVYEIYSRKDCIFILDGAASYTSNLVQDLLKETIPRRYIKKDQCPPKSPDSNPLNYYFWNKVNTKVYKDRLNTPFESEEDMISKKSRFGRNAP